MKSGLYWIRRGRTATRRAACGLASGRIPLVAPSDEIVLNQIAQGILPLSDGLDWFMANSPERRQQILLVLADMVYQAHPLQDEVPWAIQEAGLKPTYTPCVLLLKASSDRQRYHRARQIGGLPEHEQRKGFLLLLKLLEVADGRRRETTCKSGCTHWWHQDLRKSEPVPPAFSHNL